MSNSELESQIAKIQLGNTRHTTSFVYVTAEQAAASPAELFVVAELPMLNPAAMESCETICQAIAAVLRRVYKKPLTPGSFEMAIAQINEELGKLASLGQVHWILKRNCILSVRDGQTFNIATCGKTAAYLFRNEEFTDISCSPAQSHPLKTFENYAAGKIRLGDMLILSTTQIFNYIAMDRLKTILTAGDFLASAQTIIELLKETAGPEVAFGTIMDLLVPPGQANEQEVDLENFVQQNSSPELSIPGKALAYLKTMVAPNKQQKRTPQVGLPGLAPKLSWMQKIKKFAGQAGHVAGKSKSFWNSLGRGVAASRNAVRAVKPVNFKQYSPEKKFFIISAGILLIVFIFSLVVAMRIKHVKKITVDTSGQLKQAQTLLTSAESSLLYNDTAGARNYYDQALAEIPKADQISDSNKQLYQAVSAQVADFQKKAQKVTQPQITDLGTLGSAGSLLKLPTVLAVQTKSGIVDYNISSSQIQDGQLKSNGKIITGIYNGKEMVIYDGQAFNVWDPATGQMTGNFTQNVPAQNDFVGFANYPTNSRIYVVNKKTGQIVSYLVNGNNISKPVISINDPGLSNASSIAIDGAIYVLAGQNINKYQSGKAAQFQMPFLITPLSGQGKIYTDKSAKNIYVLDSGNNRILIMDKSGNLLETLTSDQFTKLIDFSVDEANKTIYVLNDSSLLKVAIP